MISSAAYILFFIAVDDSDISGTVELSPLDFDIFYTRILEKACK